MTTKNLIVAGILVLASLAALPVASAALLPDVSGPSCSVDCIKEKACDAASLNCDIQCTYGASGADVASCAPICPMVASTGSYACPGPICPVLSTDGQSAYYCPPPCTTVQYGSASIQCPRPICAYWDALFASHCPVCPPNSQSCTAICPSAANLCGLCDMKAVHPCSVPVCTRERDCYPGPIPVTCTTGPDHGDGVIPDTEDYATEMAIVTLCVIVLPEGNVVLEQVGDTAYFAVTEAYATADYAGDLLTVGCCVSAFNDHGLAAAVVGTAGTEAALACDYLADAGPTCYGGSGPSPAACPYSPPTSGGVVGDTLAFGDASCGNGLGGAGAASGAAGAIAADLQATATNTVNGLAGSVGGFAGDRAADAGAFAAETQGNAQDGASYALAGAAYAKDATCSFLFGNTACQP